MDGEAKDYDKREREKALMEQINQKGNELYKARNYAVAASLFARLYKLRPENPVWAVNYGSSLWHLNRYEEAEAILRKAMENFPRYDDARENLGKTLATLQRYDEADEQFSTVLQQNPENHRVRLQRAFARLDHGRWADGLVDYEARVKVTDYQEFPMPMWDGKADLNGKTLYVQSEQGAGDAILFSRYLWWVKKKYPDVQLNFCCHHNLAKLLWQYEANGILKFKMEGIPWHDNKADYGCYLATLPLFHGTTQDNVPLDPGLIEQRCSAQKFTLYPPELGNPLKIGICWTGNPEMTENNRRTAPVSKFLELSGDPRWLFYSLQLGPGRDSLYELMGQESICDIANELTKHGFLGTATAMSKMDLVITVCTSVAHLAGAMGVPTWLLLCKEPYWVWGRSGETTPWYQSIRIFRQRDHADWNPVFAEVQEELVKLYKTT